MQYKLCPAVHALPKEAPLVGTARQNQEAPKYEQYEYILTEPGTGQERHPFGQPACDVIMTCLDFVSYKKILLALSGQWSLSVNLFPTKLRISFCTYL